MGVGCIGLSVFGDTGCLSLVVGVAGSDGGVASCIMGQPHSGQIFLSAPTIAPQSGHLVCIISILYFSVLVDKRAVDGYGLVVIIGKFQIIEIESNGCTVHF